MLSLDRIQVQIWLLLDVQILDMVISSSKQLSRYNTYGFKMDESVMALSMKANANALKKQFPSPLVLLNFEYLVLRSYNVEIIMYTFFSELKIWLLEFLADK